MMVRQLKVHTPGVSGDGDGVNHPRNVISAQTLASPQHSLMEISVHLRTQLFTSW